MHGNTDQSIWHEGEIALQKELGVDQRMAAIGERVIRAYMPEQHREFFGRMPFVVLGTVDPEGDAWATLAEGQPGFMTSPDPYHLDFDLLRSGKDPAHAGLQQGDAVGVLGIELHTRRRNRMNGHVEQSRDDGFTVAVEQSFGNCPRYIQLRDWSFSRDPASPFFSDADAMDVLSDRAVEMIATADTFFVASYTDLPDGRRQVDVSHRGGNPGFVRIGEDDRLTIPDFAGNLYFNTLGNILSNGRAGLVFVDFESGDVLQITGDAEIMRETPDIADFQNAERLWTLRPKRIVLRQEALALRWAMREG